jgi:hypothetical protein
LKCGGRHFKDHRRLLNGLLFRTHTGIVWRDLPQRYGPWQTVHSRHRRWSRSVIRKCGKLCRIEGLDAPDRDETIVHPFTVRTSVTFLPVRFRYRTGDQAGPLNTQALPFDLIRLSSVTSSDAMSMIPTDVLVGYTGSQAASSIFF